jgi:hypothetical protein
MPSTKVEGYHNKITYSIHLPDPLSPFAEDRVNQVCRRVGVYPQENVTIRDVMVKATRNNSLMVRITVQKTNDESWKEVFVEYMCDKCPELTCLRYLQCSRNTRSSDKRSSRGAIVQRSIRCEADTKRL